MSSNGTDETGATLDAWRARGDHRFDPVRFRMIEAMTGRAAAHDGEARRILDDKVATLLAAYAEDLEKARCVEAPAAPDPSDDETLAALVDHIARHTSSSENRSATGELKTLGYFRSTWSRLSANRRLTQSLAKMPQNAGPLNSHHLVYRSLTLMRDLSPAYLHRFMAYVDTLLWVDQVNSANALAGSDTARAESPKKAARGKSSG